MPNQSVIVLDFGGQYNQLIARRVRECNVYCEVKPNTMTVDEIRAFDPIGIIFTGGPQSVYAEGSPQVDPEIFRLGIPILGICYGCQLMAQYLAGKSHRRRKDTAREYGKTETWFDTDCRLFRGLPEQSITWMSHGDYMPRCRSRSGSWRIRMPARRSASATRRAASTACSSTPRSTTPSMVRQCCATSCMSLRRDR